MAAADVEGLFRLLSAHSYPTEPSLSEGLAAALAEHVITRMAGLNAQKRGLLRDMRGAVQGGADQLTWTQLQTLNDRVAAAGRGPLYFNLVVIVYNVWSEEMETNLSEPSTAGLEDSDSEELPGMQHGVRRTRGMRPVGSGTRMSLLMDLNMPANAPAPRTLILEEHVDPTPRITGFQREVTEATQGPEPVEDMMDVNLYHCYFAIFDGLPLQELVGWRGFIDAHERHEPPIYTLDDFAAHSVAVLAMFRDNDFAREYEELLRTRDPERLTAVPEQLSSAGIANGLRAMKATIDVQGGDVVTAKIVELWEQHGERGNEDTFYRLLRLYLCPPSVQLLPSSPPPRRSLAVYRLLARLRGLV
jgi:hypothetical protein